MTRGVRVLLGIVSLSLAACSGNGGGSAANQGALRACLERPDQLPRPPASRLPCELIPPGLALE